MGEPLDECGTLVLHHRDSGEVEHLAITAEHLQWAKREILAMASHVSARRIPLDQVDLTQDDAHASMVRSMTGEILAACNRDPVRLWAFILSAGQLGHCVMALAPLAGVADPFEAWMADERP